MIEYTPFLARQIVEVISWKLVAEFHRRHPTDLTVIETHPGGGTYDCLSLVREGELWGHLNRGGGFTIHGREYERINSGDLWPQCLAEGGLGRVLNQMSHLCGLSVPTPLPRTGRETLAYRVMAGVIACVSLERSNWEWRNGQEDTSGYGNQTLRDMWFKEFPEAQNRLRERGKHDAFGNSNYRYWFLLKNGAPEVCISKTAHFWAKNGKSVDLFEDYGGNQGIYKLVGKVIGAVG